MKENLELWKQLESPPEWALKKISAGRLSGKTDINPQWRYRALTELFGPCGFGWKYEITRMWSEPGGNGEVMCFVNVNLYVKDGDKWSEAIPGTGGHSIVQSEKSGLHANDEGYKMATTDALSVACKMIGVAAKIYSGESYSKYAADEDRAQAAKDAAKNAESQKAALDAENEALIYRWLSKAEKMEHIEAIVSKMPEMNIGNDALKRINLAIQTRKNEIGGSQNNG